MTANGTITSPIDLISLALKTAGIIGVGQTASAEDSNDCFTILNAMIQAWNKQRYLIWSLVDTAFVSTGAQSYTVGIGGNYNIPRTDKLETAYVRFLQNVSPTNPFDFPLTLLTSREDYSAITLKKLSTFPTSVFYDAAYPLANLFPWPVPPATAYEIHIVTKTFIPQFANLTTAFSMPPEMIDAMIWNLCVRIRPLYQLPPDPTIVGLAKNALAVVRAANSQIPEMRTPNSILNGRAGMDVTLGNLNGLPFGGV